ncbi:hypothetical protein J2W23_000541 [Variovorax boronicumulans]|uniref:hypothetical protein n=1 Tax=Variovorax boronicumulans TaxID=436515 RepID=UPI00278507FD|nr:hypothetical protein [Variovorax boronicumulans]MDQ0012177.1 hypothetical protein [Variovorax boronicumulans]
MIVNSALASTKAATEILANRLGCTASEVLSSQGLQHPAVFDAKGAVAEKLKAAGARRAASGKALTFPSWSRLHAVLEAILKELDEFPDTPSSDHQPTAPRQANS